MTVLSTYPFSCDTCVTSNASDFFVPDILVYWLMFIFPLFLPCQHELQGFNYFSTFFISMPFLRPFGKLSLPSKYSVSYNLIHSGIVFMPHSITTLPNKAIPNSRKQQKRIHKKDHKLYLTTIHGPCFHNTLCLKRHTVSEIYLRATTMQAALAAAAFGSLLQTLAIVVPVLHYK